jgi:hypothetical protein
MTETQRYRSPALFRFNCFLIVAVIVTAVAHLLVVNDLSMRGFVFKDLKSKATEMSAEQENMQGTISSLGSSENISRRVGSLGLVAVDTVHYLSWDQSMVAKK